MIFLLLLPFLIHLSIQDYTDIGCFSSLPSSYSKSSTFQYQSYSHCSEECAGYSYFALTQGNTCICGNDAPDSSDSSSSCTTACFGYGSNTCGGDDSYDVFSMGDSTGSSSVNGAGSSSTNSQNTASSDSAATSSSATSTSSTSGGATSTKASSSTSKQSGSTTSESNTDSKTSTTAASQSTTSAVSTQSISGTTIIMYSTVAIEPSTVTSSSTSTSTSSSSDPSSSSDSKDDNKDDDNKKKSVVGPAVGGAIGGVVAVVLIGVGIFFFKRRSNKTQKDAELADSAYFSALKRDDTFKGANAAQHQRQISNPFISKEEDMVDQRLNPVMLGRRRISEGSLADEADYSRKILRVANPDDD